MLSQNLTAHEKSDRGLPLSAADIQALMKDPNSWVYKLYNDCLLEAAISELAFIRYVERIMREDAALARAELEAERAELSRGQGIPQPQLTPVNTNTSSDLLLQLSPMTILKVELTALLSLSQNLMGPAQLQHHHQQMTTNFNNQVAALLGPTITVTLPGNNGVPQTATLNVPQLSARPAASIPQILAHNPGLANQLGQDANMQAGFATNHTNTTTGFMSTMAMVNLILKDKPNRNTINNLGINAKTSSGLNALMKAIDPTVKLCQEQNRALTPELIMNGLLSMSHLFAPKPTITNNVKNLDAISFLTTQPLVSKSPAMFGMTPFQLAMRNGPALSGKTNQNDLDESYQSGFAAVSKGK